MDSAGYLSAAVYHARTILVGEFFSKQSAGVLLATGIVITLYSLVSVESLSGAGGIGYIRILFGLLFFVWGVSELLPPKYSGSIITLRISALLIIGVVLIIASQLMIFLWGMQQPK